MMTRILPVIIVVLFVGVGGLIYFLGDQPQRNLRSVQTPELPYPYEVVEMAVENEGVVLAGTLTLPVGEGPFPAVILHSVAGPADRDQSFDKHASFHVIADRLTRGGIAVARFDDRGIGGSTGNYFETSWNGFADDVIAIKENLQALPQIDAARIGAAGMSQGGAVSALAASKDEEVAFVILLSAPGLTGVAALKLQLEKTLALSNVVGEKADKYRTLFDDYMAIVQSDPDAPVTRKKLRSFLQGPGKALIPAYGFVPKDIDDRVLMFLGPWYRSNVQFDPQAAYGEIDVPVLAIGGSFDPVAPPAEHLQNIELVLSAAPTQDVTVTQFEGLNHLLQVSKTGLPNEYGKLKNTISEDVLSTMEDWINVRFGERACSTDDPAAPVDCNE